MGNFIRETVNDFVVITPKNGHLAQLGERFLHTEEVAGSSPVAPTLPNRLLSSIGRATAL